MFQYDWDLIETLLEEEELETIFSSDMKHYFPEEFNTSKGYLMRVERRHFSLSKHPIYWKKEETITSRGNDTTWTEKNDNLRTNLQAITEKIFFIYMTIAMHIPNLKKKKKIQ